MAEFAVEKLDTAFAALQVMLPAQWEHTGDSEVRLEPNWHLYRQLEEREAAFLVIARDEGAPVGYMTAFIYPHPNAVSVKVAEIKTYYAVKGQAVMLHHMIDFTIEELVKRGVFKIKAWTHAGHSAARIWELKGFEVSEIGLTMKLKAKPETKYA